MTSLPTRGAWIEIGRLLLRPYVGTRRSPHGERGLKSHFQSSKPFCPDASLPTRGAWIEIASGYVSQRETLGSLPTRGAWIEMIISEICEWYTSVAPHTGSVD